MTSRLERAVNAVREYEGAAHVDTKAADRCATTLLAVSNSNRDGGDDVAVVAQACAPTLGKLLLGAEQVAAKAAHAISRFAVRASAAIAEAGVIAPLVAQLAKGADNTLARKAVGALCNLAHDNETNRDAIREAGGIAPLVAMLAAGAHNGAAKKAAGALCNLAEGNTAISNAIHEAGGIAPLVAMLRSAMPPMGACNEATEKATGALLNLACSAFFIAPTILTAIREAGGITLLVAMLAGGAHNRAAKNAAGTLMIFSRSVANQRVICEANATVSLVALLTAGADNWAAKYAARTLYNLLLTDATAVLTSLAEASLVAPPPLADFPFLQEGVMRVASERLQHSVADDDAAALHTTLALATAVGVGGNVVALAKARLDELATEAAQQERRESLGVGHIAAEPNEFMCPITCCKMKNPVVASDGHSYERAALVRYISGRLLAGDAVISPLTREPLFPYVLIQNITLRSRIERHADEVMRVVEAAAAAARAAGEAAVALAREEGRAAERKRPAEAVPSSAVEPQPKKSKSSMDLCLCKLRSEGLCMACRRGHR